MEGLKLNWFGYHDGIPTLRYSDISDIYNKMYDQDLLKLMFSDGSILNEKQFRDMILDIQNTLFMTINYKDSVAGIVWLNRSQGKKAQIHFCFFKEWHGTPELYKMGKESIHWILNKFKDYFDVVIGYIPVWNRAANMFMHRIGATRVGVIPNAKYNDSIADSEDAIMYYATRNSIEG